MFQLHETWSSINGCNSRTWSVPNCGRRQHKFFAQQLFEKGGYDRCLDATTAVATIITQWGLTVLRTKLIMETTASQYERYVIQEPQFFSE